MKCDVYSAFGNKVRAKLLLCLSRKEKTVSEMVATCGLSQSAVSQHLTKLKTSGLVRVRKESREVYYSLKYRKAAEISKKLTQLEKEVA